jgi:hypothetical protein
VNGTPYLVFTDAEFLRKNRNAVKRNSEAV